MYNIFSALLIIGIYYNTEDSMGNYLIQIFIALAFATMFDETKIECLKNECNIVENKE